jgi:hypothetical protein
MALNSYGQSTNREAQFKAGDVALEKFLQKKFGEEWEKEHLNLNTCLISVTFARFSIDTAGNITDLKFYENRTVSPVIQKMLRYAIDATNGQWFPTIENGKKIQSKLFILPLIYEIEAGCKEPVYNGSIEVLSDLFDFKDGNGNRIMQMNCTLLSPIHIYSQN